MSAYFPPSPPRILVVDDHAQVRFLFRRVLESAGYSVCEACDGKEALETLDHGKFDLVITDWDMPVMGGEQLLAQMEEAEHSPPVLVVSSSHAIPSRHRALGKPVRPGQLVSSVKALLPST